MSSASKLAQALKVLGFDISAQSRDGTSIYMRLPESPLLLRISNHPMPATAVIRNNFLLVHSEVVPEVFQHVDILAHALECAMRCMAMVCFREKLMEEI